MRRWRQVYFNGLRYAVSTFALLSAAIASADLAGAQTPETSDLPAQSSTPLGTDGSTVSLPPGSNALPAVSGLAPSPSGNIELKAALEALPNIAPELLKLYATRSYQPIWLDGLILNDRGKLILQGFERAAASPAYALIALDLSSAHTLANMAVGEQGLALEAEIGLSRAMARFPFALPQEGVQGFDGYTLMQALPEAEDPSAFVDLILPPHPGYWQLRPAIQRYAAIVEKGGWVSIPGGPKMELGSQDSRVAQLRARLQISGDLPPLLPGSTAQKAFPQNVKTDLQLTFDASLQSAVRVFQARHGLDVDGVVGPQTLAAMNISAKDRLQSLKLNLERFRRAPTYDSAHIEVNIPAYEMRLYEKDRLIIKSRAIVGKKDRQTPELASLVSSIDLNPYWNVPVSIARKDLLPKIRADASYFQMRGIRVFSDFSAEASELDTTTVDWADPAYDQMPFRLRQDPGPLNALGRIKFNFANGDSIYMHSTSDPHLFNKWTRNLSSGCVRIEEPLEVATLLLTSTKAWPKERIQETIDSNKTVRIQLAEPVVIELTYRTAWVGDDGVLQFRSDIYGRDAIDKLLQIEMLGRPGQKESGQTAMN